MDVKSPPNMMVSNPAVKNIGGDTVGFAGRTLGILKLLLTEHALEALSFTPYPGLEETAAKVDTTYGSVTSDDGRCGGRGCNGGD
jgi:hypothetical protein